MSVKKFLWKTLIPACGRATKTPSSSHQKQISPQRLSLSDVSFPGSPIFLSDLSNSFGLNLHIFTLKDLQIITQNFSRSNYIGEGGFGEVYKGFIHDNFKRGLKAQSVAVKALNLDGTQGHREWLAEVIFLGQLKHPHLVNLIGYCCEDEHRLLVYEYIERGNLENHLFKRYGGSLPWLTRMKIALGAAKGLNFLHQEVKPVIYRDFKTSNILLDLDFTAKLSDFGLATDGPEGEDSHVTTCVMGTEGYAAPEYIMTGHLTTMSDVFSFGVVLLELLTGRRSVDKRRPCRERNLVEWARPQLKDPYKLDTLMDPTLEGQYSNEGAKKAAALAYHCLSHNPKSRPTMSTVVSTLGSVMEFKDIPVGPFVYIVPTEGQTTQNQSSDVKNKNPHRQDNDQNKDKVGRGRGRRRRRRVKSLRSRAVHSDTTLYEKLGSSLYSPLN